MRRFLKKKDAHQKHAYFPRIFLFSSRIRLFFLAFSSCVVSLSCAHFAPLFSVREKRKHTQTNTHTYRPSHAHTSSGARLLAHASNCNIAATHCNTLQHTATYCNALQRTAKHYSTQCAVCVCVCSRCMLQCVHTATYCNALQHTTTHCNTLQHIRARNRLKPCSTNV